MLQKKNATTCYGNVGNTTYLQDSARLQKTPYIQEMQLKEREPEENKYLIWKKRKNAAKRNCLLGFLGRNWRRNLCTAKIFSDLEVDQTFISQWLMDSGFKLETKALLIAFWDQFLPTRNYQYNVLKLNSSHSFHVYVEHPWRINHIISGCGRLRLTDYLQHHDTSVHVLVKLSRIQRPSPRELVGTLTITGCRELSGIPAFRLIEKSMEIHQTWLKNPVENICLLIYVVVSANKNIIFENIWN